MEGKEYYLTIDDVNEMCDQVIKFSDKCASAQEFLLLHEVSKFKEILNIMRCQL